MWVVSTSSLENIIMLCGKALSPLCSLSISMGTTLGVGDLEFEP